MQRLNRKSASVTPDTGRDPRGFAALAGSKNTQRAYRADFKHFAAWCKQRNKRALPASPDDVALYLRFCAQQQKLKPSTARRRLAAISEVHARNRHESPVKEWVVRNTLKKLRTDLGTQAKSKHAILVQELKAMVAACPDNLSGKRDKAVLLLGFAGAFRRSELAALDVEHISTADEGLVITVHRNKALQVPESRQVAIPFGRDPLTCPVKALLDWLDHARIDSGPVFRSLTRFDRLRGSRMPDKVVTATVKKYCRLTGKRPAVFSSHSLRAGLATSAALAGASESSIQRQTGHKSLHVLRRYFKDVALFKDNALLKVAL